ncbi:hypothetical protein ACFQPC_00415 [Herminiimonas glaciei]|uniref:Uncharacterized protein n=1 Tax=Herminiimonas glaciei TaxID=523788 RepID=A0ABW2I686_9BURK
MTVLLASQDFLYVDLTEELSREESAIWKDTMGELDVLQAPTEDVQYFGRKGHEFPMPFNFGGPKFYEYESGTAMNRAERRRMAREARKKSKKANNI